MVKTGKVETKPITQNRKTKVPYTQSPEFYSSNGTIEFLKTKPIQKKVETDKGQNRNRIFENRPAKTKWSKPINQT
jgi:hypothetical protein